MQMNNPLGAMINAVKNGGNPMALLQMAAGDDPRIQQFSQMVNGKSAAELRQMAENMARERGTTVEEVARSLGFYR